jgi:hypothetical protein
MANNPVIKRIDWLNELSKAGESATDRVLLGKFDTDISPSNCLSLRAVRSDPTGHGIHDPLSQSVCWGNHLLPDGVLLRRRHLKHEASPYGEVNLFEGWIQMLIRYRPKNDHIKCVPLIPTTDELKALTLTRSQVQLLPGINEVTDSEWKVMKEHLAAEIKSGVLAPIIRDVPKTAKAPTGKAKNLKEMPAKEAVKLIKGCMNPDTLKKWYQEETREEVRLVIVKKMEELKVEIPEFTGSDTITDEPGDSQSSGEKENEKK